MSYNSKGEKTVTVIEDAGEIVAVPDLEADVAIISSNISKININVLKKLKKEENVLALDAQSFINYVGNDKKLIKVRGWKKRNI